MLYFILERWYFEVASSFIKKHQKKSEKWLLEAPLGNGMQAANVFIGVKCKLLTCFYMFFSNMIFLPSFVYVQLPNLFQSHYPQTFTKRRSVGGS